MKCFDSLDKSKLINSYKNNPHKDILNKWLNRGIKENIFKELWKNEKETVQGDIVSPTLTNILMNTVCIQKKRKHVH